MNGNLSKDNADDLLARSLNAMRNAPIPDGPSQEVLADTLAALGSAADLSGSLKIKRFTSMKFITRFAASILLACGLAAIAFVSFHPSIALADVVKKVRDARSVTFFTSMTIPGAKDQVGRIKVIVDNAGHTRVEHADGMTVTLDMISGKALMLVPKTKTAVTMTFKTAGAMNLDPSTPNGPSGLMIDPIQEFKKLAGKPSKDLGEKTIDGKNAKGFIVTQDGHDITVWADAKTGDPVRMEIGLPFMGQQATVVVNDFVFDAPIDAGLFSLAVPKDYQLTEMQVPNINKDGEKVVIEALKGFAERSGGQFPNRLDDWSEFTKLVKSDPENPSKLDAATTQWMGSIGAMTPFLLSLPGDSHAYLGKGVTLNQKDAIIFWYRNAESGKCRAIYADLTVKDADPKTLPKAPPAEARPSLPPTPVPATSAIKRVAPPATAAPIRATPKEVAPK